MDTWDTTVTVVIAWRKKKLKPYWQATILNYLECILAGDKKRRVLPYFRRIQNSEVAIFCVDSYKMQDDTEFKQGRP